MGTRINKLILIFGILIYLAGCQKQNGIDNIPLAKKEFTFFEFKTAHNPNLIEDLTGVFQQDTIHITVLAGTNLKALKPSFSTAIDVKVNGITQVSDKSPQDFTKLVTYQITIDGISKNYVVKVQDTKLPVLYISTNNRPIQTKTTYIAGKMSIKNSNGELYNGEIEIRGRGNSTWNFPKKPYKIKLNEKAPLLGMNADKHWVLLANYADKSLIRNEVGFELSRRLGLAFTPAGRFVEVVLNDVYIGNYQLVEAIEVDKEKVNLAETTKDDITGGYLVEVDGFNNTEDVNFRTPRGMPISVHYPESEDITAVQRNYIGSHFNKFEVALFETPFDSPTNNYRKFFDLKSYVSFYLVNEIMGNSDIFWSTYLYKQPQNDLLYAGPVWDFDISANNDFRIGDSEKKLMIDAAHQPRIWINQLMKDKEFRTQVRNRWNEVYPKLQLTGFIDGLAEQLIISQKKNFVKWPILNQKVHFNYQAAGSYEAEVTFLKDYLKNRTQWLNGQFNSTRFQ